jgi:hypothetical protein
MTVNRAANTLKFYDLFDKKSATGNWYDVYSTIPGADVKNTDGCAMLSNRSIEQNLSGDDVTIPYLNYDTIIANKADSKKKGISAKPVTGINNAASPTPKSADMLCSDNSGVLGWVLCPVLKLLDGAINWVEGQIKDFLFIDPSHFSRTGTDGGTSGLYKAWSTFRGIATVVIVIIALLMIFSEAMGQGIFDNYSVKKILPKLLLAGIAIQLSWFLMTSLVNIFNIIGDGIGGLMLQPFTTNGKPIGDSIVSVLPPTDTKGGLLVGIVGGIAIVGLIIGLVGFGIAILGTIHRIYYASYSNDDHISWYCVCTTRHCYVYLARNAKGIKMVVGVLRKSTDAVPSSRGTYCGGQNYKLVTSTGGQE